MANEKGPILTALEEVRKNPTLASEALAKRSAQNTRRAAPVEGLETVQPLYGPKTHVCWTPDNTPIQDRELVQLMPEGDYVRFDQAEAIIAAKDARIEFLEKVAADQQTQIVEYDTLEADNAALTARVKELEGERDHWKANHDCVLGKYRLATQRPDLPVDRLPAIRKLEALETQLAAARKALEWYANPEIYRSHPHGIGFEDRDKSYVAKAALEAKP